jgi:hypothetical protein
MKPIFNKAAIGLVVFIMLGFLVNTIATAFNPPELFDCEDIGDINYPTPPELYWIVPEGTYVETTCGMAMVGYHLSCRYDSTLDDDIYYCEYDGTFLNRCYLIQTNDWLINK